MLMDASTYGESLLGAASARRPRGGVCWRRRLTAVLGLMAGLGFFAREEGSAGLAGLEERRGMTTLRA